MGMAIIVAPENQLVIDALNSSLKDELMQWFEAFTPSINSPWHHHDTHSYN